MYELIDCTKLCIHSCIEPDLVMYRFDNVLDMQTLCDTINVQIFSEAETFFRISKELLKLS